MTDSDDALGRLLETAARMDDRLRQIDDKFRQMNETFAKLLADYEFDRELENARRRIVYEGQMRQGLQSPYLARGFLANQQPRLDGDKRPWEPRK